MTPSKKNDTMGITLRRAPAATKEPAPSPAERNALAVAARDRLHEATKEAFPRSAQYRPAGDGTGIVGSDAK